ncbi:hypothetical protein V7S43_002207 [Phytophthora oleae]|uniref:Uncharacterized protein n=1 Tax=Phytophthora oleae TaxID=2107226 RepID=A0ABD3G4I6_9STRA
MESQTAEDTDALLVLSAAFFQQDEELCEVRREVFDLLIAKEWKIAMRSRHYLTAQCLDAPSESALMIMYQHGNDTNFLNATSLTRATFNQLLQRFSQFYTIPGHSTRDRPPKLRYHHQVLSLLLCFYAGSMEQSTLLLLFGVPPSTLLRTLQRAEEAYQVSPCSGGHKGRSQRSLTVVAWY